MKTTEKLIKITTILLILITLTSLVNATVLVNARVDKSQISTNEVNLLIVDLYNNGTDITNYPIRIETSSNLVLSENEQHTLLQYIDLLKEGVGKEVKIKFKAINTEKETGEIFVYYGDELKFVSGTYVSTKELPVMIKTTAEKRIEDDVEKIIIDFELYNYSKTPIYNIGLQAIAPENFEVNNPQEIIPIIYDNNKISQRIEILPPLGINGEQKVLLAYGYFDENTPHYFEETFTFEFTKSNNFILAGIGLIVLVIAVLIYMSKGNKPKQDIKGTAEKAGEN
ncbi:MAG: hypothetical protein WC915_03625 [archaeon]|jgi:hypothetical protein